MPNLKYVIKRALNMDYHAMLKKINSIHKKTKKSRLAIFNDMRKCALKYGAGYMDYDLFEMYNLTDAERDTYITRGRNNDLIKKYNNPEYAYIFANKVEFNKTFNKFIKRDYLKVRGSSKEDILNFITKHKVFMAKPVDGTCGKGIEKLSIENQDLEELYTYLTNPEHNFLLEEVLTQCDEVSQIHPESINTVRIVTILDNKDIPHIICAYFRIGNGKYVDNFNSGGMAAPVDEKTGIVKDLAIDKNKNLYERHPETNALIKGFKFPFWDEALAMVKEASLVEKHIRYVGWDVCFTPDGPVLVEGNDYPGHDIYQLPEHTHDKKGIWPKFTQAFEDEA